MRDLVKRFFDKFDSALIPAPPRPFFETCIELTV